MILLARDMMLNIARKPYGDVSLLLDEFGTNALSFFVCNYGIREIKKKLWDKKEGSCRKCT